MNKLFNIFSALALLFAPLPLLAVAPKFSNNTARNLAENKLFPIPKGRDVVAYLEQRAQRLETLVADTSAFEDSPNALDGFHLELGDLYHWLGHIADDRLEFKQALKHHQKALTHYKLSRIAASPRIRGLVGVDHAQRHIRKSTRLNAGLPDEGSHEISLYYGNEFSIPRDAEVVPFLENRAAELLRLTVRPGVPKAGFDAIYLEVGDIHYWLGLIAQDHWETAKARRLYETAGSYYEVSALEFSPRLYGHNVRVAVRQRLHDLTRLTSSCEALAK